MREARIAQREPGLAAQNGRIMLKTLTLGGRRTAQSVLVMCRPLSTRKVGTRPPLKTIVMKMNFAKKPRPMSFFCLST